MPDFQTVADAVAAEIGSGKLTPGTRLPPQRSFADQHGIATSTASRVYAELVRRGLVVGEVGRGTFVRAPETLRAAMASEAAGAPIDLQIAVSSDESARDAADGSWLVTCAGDPPAAKLAQRQNARDRKLPHRKPDRRDQRPEVRGHCSSRVPSEGS